MPSPDVNRLQVVGPAGTGACGRMFRARDESGRELAVKILNPSAVNPALLEETARRFEEGGWPSGVLEELGADYHGKQLLRITRFLADDVDGESVPRSLQHRLARFPGDDSWPVVLEILRALAAMHDRQVAHGNLKPGNVFFDDDGKVVLTDWALGNMPGVQTLEYTDAILYQPPEQLRDPSGYVREKGYRWDVFAFGVLAYRLITGAFPRCTETFDEVAPAPGVTRREGIAANLKSIAKMIEGKPEITWPDAPANPLESAYREHIERCLSFNPALRPANAGAVLRLFEADEKAISEEQLRESLLDQHRRARRSAWRAHVVGGVMAGVALVFSLMWTIKTKELDAEERGRRNDIARLESERKVAETMRSDSDGVLDRERKELQYQKDLWLARLEASRATGDHLFTWAMEKGQRKLPPLDGREHRLKRLESYFEEFISRTEGVESLKEERARVRLQLAEVSLGRGDPKVAAERLKEALASSSDLPAGPDLDLRLATDRLLLALLLQDRNDPEADAAFVTARQSLEAVPQASVDADRVQQLLAVLDFHESKLLAAEGKDDAALNQLHRATQSLSKLSEQRPDATVLRSELASCFLDSATILDAIGEMGSAREVRAQASEELLDLLKKEPGNLDLRQELAGCYGGMAEAAYLSGDMGSASSMSGAAVKLLEELMAQQPDRSETRSMLAGQYGLMAGILRDRGETKAARKHLDDGILLVEQIAVSESSDPTAKYRLAWLLWQKGRMVGADGARAQEIELETRAADIVRKLLASDDSGVLRAEQVRRSFGYILGDLGHAAQLADKPELAQAAFGEAVAVWTQLNRERPQNEEYEEGLAWCQQRLKEL
ncbi:protein kinase [Luteolibacter flavescens]|uniref:Protein kinase n=1 Tax=Luteolibacter flavescens TaxID=1859460 RepID=A0ABT3FJ49_9BACT|nr:protein kinase [Luteolibacter flavescens]MCW1883477.1 protein kinase [Luteolibacter flavescens]